MNKFKRTLCGQKLSLDDMTQADEAIISYSQSQSLSKENACFEKRKPDVNRNRTILRLDPVLKDALVRVGGRIFKSSMPQKLLRPVLLTKESHIAKLILRALHERVGHGGRCYMLSRLSLKYWILHANTAARKVINECMFCCSQKGQSRRGKDG